MVMALEVVATGSSYGVELMIGRLEVDGNEVRDRASTMQVYLLDGRA